MAHSQTNSKFNARYLLLKHYIAFWIHTKFLPTH